MSFSFSRTITYCVNRSGNAVRSLTVATCVLENPVRAGLVSNWQAYRFSGSSIPGFPMIDPREQDFWEKFWRIFARLSGGALEAAGKER
jgi:hypothetical protein